MFWRRVPENQGERSGIIFTSVTLDRWMMRGRGRVEGLESLNKCVGDGREGGRVMWKCAEGRGKGVERLNKSVEDRKEEK